MEAAGPRSRLKFHTVIPTNATPSATPSGWTHALEATLRFPGRLAVQHLDGVPLLPDDIRVIDGAAIVLPFGLGVRLRRRNLRIDEVVLRLILHPRSPIVEEAPTAISAVAALSSSREREP